MYDGKYICYAALNEKKIFEGVGIALKFVRVEYTKVNIYLYIHTYINFKQGFLVVDETKKSRVKASIPEQNKG